MRRKNILIISMVAIIILLFGTVLSGTVEAGEPSEEESKAIIAEKEWNENLIEEVRKETIKRKTYYIPIPKGFEYEEGTIETGFKIKDTDNLSFI